MIVSRILLQEIFDTVKGAYTTKSEPATSPTGWDDDGMPIFEPKILKIANFSAKATEDGIEISSDNVRLMKRIEKFIEG